MRAAVEDPKHKPCSDQEQYPKRGKRHSASHGGTLDRDYVLRQVTLPHAGPGDVDDTLRPTETQRVKGMCVGVAAAVLVASANGLAASGGVSAPPPGLTPAGRLTWELDALMRKAFGARQVCFDNKRLTLFAVPGQDCPLPLQRYLPYEYTFAHPQDSALRLVRLSKEPLTGVTNEPVRIREMYISCPNGAYHHGHRGWLVFGGGGPLPGSWFWCN